MEEYITDFDADFYINSNNDLKKFSHKEAIRHFKEHGISEGRIGSKMAYRENFIKSMDKSAESILEIGPFANPCFSGNKVKYFDVLNHDQLHQRAKEHKLNESKIPKLIHYVDAKGDLSIIDDSFDMVFSCHCIEHQPDLIEHLIGLSRLTSETGNIVLIIPDKRFCFDYFIPESDLATVISAHLEKHTLHTQINVIRHRMLTTHNNPIDHWNHNHGELGFDSDKLDATVKEWEDNIGKYIDVHAWQFTPNSFLKIISSLQGLGLIDLSVISIFNTPRDCNEFCVYLGKV
jgi:hypothetical protein